jgi:hypothetical protein
MANNKQRYINTRIWNDNYVSELDPIEKLLFLYFLTNEHTNISGIYELPLKVIGVETGIDKEMLIKILPRLESKIKYIDGKVVIKNHIKYQELSSPNIVKGIKSCLNDLDQKWLKSITDKGYYINIHTPPIPLTNPSDYSNSNSNSNSNKDTSSKEDTHFLEFWNIYPKKELKKKTQEIWKRKKLDSVFKEISEFITEAKKTDRWKKGYIKQPPAFLNGECWKDDLSSYGGVNQNSVYKNTDSDSMIEKLKAKQL